MGIGSYWAHIADDLLDAAEFDVARVNVDLTPVSTAVGSDHEPPAARFDLNEDKSRKK